MIRITNGSVTLTVPNAAYRGFYAASGFHPVVDQERIAPVIDEAFNEEEPEFSEADEAYDDEADETEALDEEIDLSEIPIGEMDFYQLCDYADRLGIDRRGIRSKRELRDAIRANL